MAGSVDEKNENEQTADDFDVESIIKDGSGLVDAATVRKILWKLDLHIIPFVVALYLCSFLDRVNIGNAKLAGLASDIGISPSDFNWAVSIFFVGYILFEVPSNIMLAKVGPRRWIPIVMIAWGGVMMCMAAVKNTAGLLASRVFLGVTEAGLFPGILFYLSFWFTRRELTTRVALLLGGSTLAGAFGGVLAYGIMQMNGLQNLRGWQWIFIIEAIPTIILSLVTYFALPDTPKNAKFLTQKERDIVVHRLREDAGPSVETHFSWKQFRAAFTDYKVYMHALIVICGSAPMYSLSLFLPSIINGMGFTNLNAQAMSAPPYAIACVFEVLVAMHADRYSERGLHVAIPSFVGILGYLLLIILKDRGAVVRYIAACITTTGVFTHSPAMLSWFPNNIGGYTKRGVAIAFIISIGSVGGAIGGQIYRDDDKPYYTRGHKICLGLLCGAACFSLLFKFLLHRENKRRVNLTPEEFKREASGEDLCDLHPGFRYIT